MKGSERIKRDYFTCTYNISPRCIQSTIIDGAKSRKIAKECAISQGWNVINDKTICPECSKAVLSSAHPIKQ